jgi:hypothetical protein
VAAAASRPVVEPRTRLEPIPPGHGSARSTACGYCSPFGHESRLPAEIMGGGIFQERTAALYFCTEQIC